MTRPTTLFTALLAAVMATTALANPAHHPPDTEAGATPMGAGHEMMNETETMRQMHEMMTMMHGGQMPGMTHGDTNMPALGSLASDEFEVAFMSMMIAHHQGAIDMAGWVLERGSRRDVLGAAQAIKEAQAPEIEQMTAWLHEWYGAGVDSDYAAMMDAEMSGMMAAMEESADADSAFLREMIAHHQGAIDMAQLALERATHAELRNMARDIIVAQADEVNQYQTWLDAISQ